MSDADKNLTVKVGTVGDTSGANRVGESLTDVSKQSAKAGEAAHEMGKGFDKAEISGRELRLLINELGPNVDGLAHALTSVTSPIALIGFSVVVLKSLFEQFNKTLEETTERNAKASDSYKILIEGHAAARQSLAEFNEEMERTATVTESANTAFEARMKLLKAEGEAGKQHAKDMGATPLQEAYLDKANKDAEIAARANHLGLAQVAQPGLEKAAQEADVAAHAEETRRKKLTADAEIASKESERLKKEMTEAADNKAHTRAMAESNPGAPGVGERAARAHVAYDTAAAAYEQNQKTVHAPDNLPPDVSAQRAIDAKADAKKNKVFIDKEGPAIQSDIDVNAVNFNKEKRSALNKTDIGGGLTGKDVEKASELEQLLAEHKALTKDQAAFLEHFREITGETTKQQAMMISIVGSATDTARTQAGLLTKVQALEVIITQMKERSKFIVNNPPVGG